MSANDEERVYIDGIPPQCDLFDVKRIFDDTCSPLSIRFFDKDQRYPPFRTATAFFKNLTESLKAIVLFNVRPVSTATTTFNPILSLSVETARTRYHNCRLAVRGIPTNATLEDVYRLFNPFGLIVLIQLADDYHNDQCKYAKVFYADRFSAQTACRRLNGAYLKGSIIVVKVKDSKPSTHQPHQSTYFRANVGTATKATKRSGSLVSVPTGAQNVIPSSQTYEDEVIRDDSNQHSELEALNASTAHYTETEFSTTRKKRKIAETKTTQSSEEEPMTKPIKLHVLRKLGYILDRLLQSDADSGSWSTDTNSHALSILYEKMLRLKTSNTDQVKLRSVSWGGNSSDTHQIMLGLTRRRKGLLNGLTVRLGSKMQTNNLESAWEVVKHPNSAIGVDRFQNRYSSVHPQEQSVTNPPAPLIRCAKYNSYFVSIGSQCGYYYKSNWEKATKPTWRLQHEKLVSPTSLAAGRDYIAIGYADSSVRFWRIPLHEPKSEELEDLPIVRQTGHDAGPPALSLAWSPSERDVVSAQGHNLRFMHVQEGPNWNLVFRNVYEKSRLTAVTYLDSGTVICGSEDGSILLYDLRKLAERNTKPLLTLSSHTGPVTKVQSCLHHPDLFASSSVDGTVILWDAKGGREKRLKEFSPSSWDIPEEKYIVFRHCLHRSPVVDFEWNPYRSEKYTIASVSSDSDNVDLQVWQIHPSLL